MTTQNKLLSGSPARGDCRVYRGVGNGVWRGCSRRHQRFSNESISGPLADFLAPINRYPELVLRFFGRYAVRHQLRSRFVGSVHIHVRASASFAMLGLGAGLLTALFDASENGFYIVYATSVRNGADLIDPAYTLLIMLTYLENGWRHSWIFACIWSGVAALISYQLGLRLLMLSFPLGWCAGHRVSHFFELRGLYFLIGFPTLPLPFWRQLRGG